MSAKKLIKVKPQAFVNDERTEAALAIFMCEESNSKFSIQVDTEINVNLFLKESFKRKESGFTLSHDFVEAFDYHVDMALLDINEEMKSSITLFLKHKTNASMPLKEMKIQVFELLGLWNVKDFSIYASKDFISSSREAVLEAPKEEVAQFRHLHKRYGQKYLI